MLGPYGNTWVPTRAFNRLAGEAWLSEFSFTTSPRLADVYRSWWHGEHPLAPQSDAQPLVQRWRSAGLKTALVTDDAELAQFPGTADFDDQVLVEHPAATEPATGTDETQFAQLAGAVMDRLEQLPERFALWLHARGLSGAWDAPTELREHLRDDEDPLAATLVDPPVVQLGQDYDPDALVPLVQAYAAQVLAIDEGLEALLDALEESGRAADTLVVVTSPRGYLLGQQGEFGSPTALLEDQLHVPLLVRFPTGQRAAERELALLEPRDLHALLASPGDWTPASRERVLIRSDCEQALRTPAWLLCQQGDEAPQLYAKPDDRYEVNDVAGRCQSVVEALQAELTQTAAALASGSEASLPSIAEELADTLR